MNEVERVKKQFAKIRTTLIPASRDTFAAHEAAAGVGASRAGRCLDARAPPPPPCPLTKTTTTPSRTLPPTSPTVRRAVKHEARGVEEDTT